MLARSVLVSARAALGLLLVAVVTVAVGALLAGPLDDGRLVRDERSLAASLADRRTGMADAVSGVLAGLTEPWVVAGATLLAVLALLVTRGQHARAAGSIVAATAGAVGVAVVAGLLVDRAAPTTDVLGTASTLGTGSRYPAGGLPATVALAVALALLAGFPAGARPARRVLAGLCIAMPVAAGAAVVYRGTSGLWDVTAAVVAGTACAWVPARVVAQLRWRDRPALRAPRVRGGPPRRAAIVLNPTKVADVGALRGRVEAAMAHAGWQPPLWLETTVDEPGRALALSALESGCDVVFAAGGDGTVMAVVSGLVGSDIPLALLPVGTGNLLARNLGIPLDEDEAIDVGIAGDSRRIDVGRVDDAGHLTAALPDVTWSFAVMAGIGFDAAMVRDAPERLKATIGWPAYAVAAARNLRGSTVRMSLTLDDREPVSVRARTVVVGNVGRLQAGIPLLPDAEPDDGLLDVVVVGPSSALDWARVVGDVLTRGRRDAERLERFRARKVTVRTERPQPRHLDGDVIGEANHMTVEVDPSALLVKVPRP